MRIDAVRQPTNCHTTEILENTKLVAQFVFWAIYGTRVAARRDPDGHDAEDDNHVCRHNDAPEDALQDAFVDDAGQGDCEGDFGPGRSDGGHGCRDVVQEEELALVIVGLITGCDGAAQERSGD